MVVPAAPGALAADTVQKALVHHPVSTKSAEAQELFDEGLTLVYAFNREEAQNRFRAAAAADPTLAMAWWGVALAAGPNLNIDMTPEDWKTVREALGKARSLASGASPEERQLIETLGKRYPANAKDPSGKAYRAAMSAVHSAFPTDDDVATLYVESAMDADNWGFKPDGSPIGNTAALVATLDEVIARNPTHAGANHYLVHLYDFQASAERGLVNANRLSALPIEPAASHLKHMSGHIYFDLGMFAALQRDNRTAVEDDRTYAESASRKADSLDYYFHNLDFYTGGSLMLGDDAEAQRGVEYFLEANHPNAMLALDRDQRFREALAAIPKATPKASLLWLARWHYARGIAFVSLGQTDAAQGELSGFVHPPANLEGYERRFIETLADILDARISYALGARAAAIEKLRRVVAGVAGIPPEGFAAWYYPVGEWLGWMLIGNGDAAGAEAAFRADLARTPHNPRALYGLMRALSAQDKTSQGDSFSLEIVRNWRGSPADLRDRL